MLEDVDAHLLVLGIEAGVVGGEVALVGSGRGGEVCELREDEAKLMVGSVWAERLRRYGATVSFERAGVRAGGGDVLGVLGRERARE